MLPQPLVQGWMGTSLVLETTLTVITWSVLPLPFQIWSVGCLIMDGLIYLRECVRPRSSQNQMHQQTMYPTMNVGLLI